jgi:sulfur-carrier protein adenylyltransferase/sulfurtransferase
MLTNNELQRYSRHLLIPEIGIEGQQRLKCARIAVVGCGGLGSPVLLYLAAAGIGTLGLIDGDRVDDSNLQRQVLFGIESIGKPKVTEAAKRLQSLNPYIKIITFDTQITSQNAIEILTDFDLVIDGTDNFATRYLLNDACVLLNKPLVYGAIYRFEGQVAVFNHQNGVHYRDLFPEPPPPELAPNCAEAGVLGVLPGIIGCMQANEALKIIVGYGQPLSGKLWVMDTRSMISRIIKIPKNPAVAAITQLIDYEEFCNIKIGDNFKNISPEKLQQWLIESLDFQLIDVRTAQEYAIDNIGGQLIPLDTLEKNINQIDRTKAVVIHCQSGKRSQNAIDILQNKYSFNNLYNLEGGLNEYRQMLG